MDEMKPDEVILDPETTAAILKQQASMKQFPYVEHERPTDYPKPTNIFEEKFNTAIREFQNFNRKLEDDIQRNTEEVNKQKIFNKKMLIFTIITALFTFGMFVFVIIQTVKMYQ